MQQHWDSVFTAKPDRFGSEPSISAKTAVDAFEHLQVAHPRVLDLGSGTGRDALYFARRGMDVVALDFSNAALDALQHRARLDGVAQSIQTVRHDVRDPLPFEDSIFDACYAHMLYCMDFTLAELSALFTEVRRILKPRGIHMYTARNTQDPDFGVGTHRGEQLWEDEGVVIHFFDRDMVERLAAGFRILDVTEFEEGALPRRLFLVTQQKFR